MENAELAKMTSLFTQDEIKFSLNMRKFKNKLSRTEIGRSFEEAMYEMRELLMQNLMECYGDGVTVSEFIKEIYFLEENYTKDFLEKYLYKIKKEHQEVKAISNLFVRVLKYFPLEKYSGYSAMELDFYSKAKDKINLLS